MRVQPDRNGTKGTEDRTHSSLSIKMAERYKAEEIRNIWNNFLKEASCHGMKHIGGQTRSKTTRKVYGFFVLVSLIGLLWTVPVLLMQVLMYNTVTRTEIYVDPNMTFPTITLCNICPFNFRDKNESDPLYRLLAKASVYGSLMPELDLNEPPFRYFLQQTTQDIMDEYFMDVGIRYAEYDGSELSLEQFESLELDPQNGRCYQFNGHHHVVKQTALHFKRSGPKSGLRVLANIRQDDYGIVDDGTAGLRVYISYREDFPPFHTHGIVVMPGTSTKISLKPHKISFLPSPYLSFGSEYCVDLDEESPVLVAKMVNATFYSFGKCRDQCIAYKASMECSCYNPSLVVPGLKACTAYEYMYGCYNEASERIKVNVSTHCDCPRRCTFTQYDVTLSASQLPSKASQEASMKFFNETDISKIKDNFLEVQVYFDSPLMRVEKHDPEYTFQNFVSMLGGQMGICLGASLITLVELWELILRMFFVGIRCSRK